MRLHFGGAAVATGIAFAFAVACSAADPGGDPAGGPDGSSGGLDGTSGPDALTDGQANPDGTSADGATDGGADGALDAEVDAGPPIVRFVGRFDTTPAGGPKVAWPGAQIIARFSGTEVKATFADAPLFSPEYGANRWEVFIDGVSKTILQLDRTMPMTTYTLATGLPLAAHTVELYKLTEGSVGMTQFLGFDFSGGTLLPPPLPKTRHMQFLGDSSSNGYGVDGLPGCSFSAATENERKSYGALIAHMTLLADHHNLSASGKGIYQNYSRPGDTDVFSVIYQRAGVSFFSAPAWDYTAYSPDVVWMTLGGNDYDDPDGNPNNAPDVPPAGQFQVKYDALVTTIRTQHPGAHIFCAVAPSLNDTFPTGYNAYTNVKTAAQNVVNAHVAAADNKIYYFEFTRSANGDTTACDGHVNVAKHRAMADEAIVVIKAKTGW